MKKVDNDVQTYTDSFVYVWQSLLDLWATIPTELKMYLAVMYSVSAIIQYYKRAFLMEYYKEERKRRLRLVSLPLSVLISIGAFFIYQNKMHYGWFIFSGLTAWWSVMMVHAFAVNIAWPFIKSISKFRLQKVNDK